MKQNTFLCLLLGASLAAVAACGSDSKSSTMPVTSATEPVEPAEPPMPAEPAKPAEPQPPPEPPAPTYLHGKMVWFELESSNPAKSTAFFNELLGWTTEPQAGAEGAAATELVKAGGKEVAMVRKAEGKKAKSRWVPFVSVPDVDGAVTAVEANKGKVVKPAQDVPDVGRFAVVSDPNGAVFAVFKSAAGDQPDGQPKAGEFIWAENLTKNKKAHASALAFYPTVVGYTNTPMEMATGKKKKKDTYDMLSYGETPRAAVEQAKPASLGGRWLPWVAVDDVDAAVGGVKKLKGKVVVKPFDVPTVGRMAVVADPTGAALGLMKPLSPEERKAAEDAGGAPAEKK
jgi:hypothetical protein